MSTAFAPRRPLPMKSASSSASDSAPRAALGEFLARSFTERPITNRHVDMMDVQGAPRRRRLPRIPVSYRRFVA